MIVDMDEPMRRGARDYYPHRQGHLDRHRRGEGLSRVVEVEIDTLDIDLQAPPLDYTLNEVLSFPVLLSPVKNNV